MTDPSDTPLPSSEEESEEAAPEEEEVEPESTELEAAPAESSPRPAPPKPSFSFSTMILVFLGLLGVWMLIDTGTRNSIVAAMGNATNPSGFLYVAIGFNSQYLLVTMALAGAIEMGITAIAYNYTTDWIKAAKVGKWSSAFRKVQMAAIRSGKKDRIDALKVHQGRLTRLSSEVSIAQLKGMAVTWFLLIVIYSWVGEVIVNAYRTNPNGANVSIGGSIVDLAGQFGPFPLWFFIFSLYTIPLSFVFRRFLKHWWLLRYEARHSSELASRAA